jgi:ABC-type lipoprotein release transport system permease subunit
MLLQIKLAWRNIFRNKRRTLIASMVIGIGLVALIFMDALMNGMERSMIHSATQSFMGDAEIHRKGFQDTYDVEKTVNDLDTVVAGLENEAIVTHFAPRAISYAAISSPLDMSSVTMVGVDPETERLLSQIDDAITKGSYFDSSGMRNIVLGDKLAKTLQVDLGDRVVLTASQANANELAQELFRVSGVFHMGMDEFDKGMVFIRLKKAQEMLNLNGQVHEIALDFTNSNYGRDTTLAFWSKFSRHGNIAEGWAQLMPQLLTAFKLSTFSIFLTGLILFGVVALSIVNALFMSLYERMYEFGVMLAIGTRKGALMRMIIFEAGALAIVSAIAGIILGFIVNLVFAHIGIDFTGSEYSGVTFREPIRLVMKAGQFIFYPILVFLLTIFVSLYPALYAARLTPVKAMRKAN